MAKTDSSKKKKSETAPEGGDINVGGNVTGDHIIVGNNNVIHYYAVNGEKREMRTGWFFGHRYGDLETFTGRAAELDMLNEWLNNDKDNLLMLRALGGFGKSALTWHWFNSKVDKEKWQTAVWWSFYEKESGFESFLADTLAHLGIETKERSHRLQINDLLETMRWMNILIVLDGFERLLRQYSRMDVALQPDYKQAKVDPSQRDCSSPLTETFLRGLSGAGMRSKVLMTTQLCPRVLESADGKLLKGCRDETLSAFLPMEAVEYFHKQEIKGRRDEIESICKAYGYHPLSLSLLIGLINEDHEHRGNIAAVKNREIFGDVKAQQYHVLESAYKSLAPERRDLLSKISCFRGSMEYAVLKKVFPSPDLEIALLDLCKRGLLQYAGETQSYDMHPIVRHYTYNHFTDEKQRKEAHVQLATHFRNSMPVDNEEVKTLEDLTPIIELYHHTVGTGNLDEAVELLSERLIPNPLYYQFGAYQLCIELMRALFLNGEYKSPRLKNEAWQAWVLNSLAISYSMSGSPQLSIPLLQKSVEIRGKRISVDKKAPPLGNLAVQQIATGSLRAADLNIQRNIQINYDLDVVKLYNKYTNPELGRLFSIRGLYNMAVTNSNSHGKTMRYLVKLKYKVWLLPINL